jgi:hypothetical protein
MIEVQIEEEGLDMDAFTKAFQKRALRAGLHVAGQYWYREFAPRHFEDYAPAKYGYDKRKRLKIDPRTEALAAWKRRRGQGGRSTGVLQVTGRLKRMHLGGALIKNYGSGRVIVRTQMPKYATINRRNAGSYPDIKKELTATTEGEREKLMEIVVDSAVEWLEGTGKEGLRKNRKGAGRPRG